MQRKRGMAAVGGLSLASLAGAGLVLAGRLFLLAGTCIATGGTDGAIKVWDLRSNRLIQYYEAHDGAVTDLSFHPSGNFLLSSSMDSTLKARAGTASAHPLVKKRCTTRVSGAP